MGLAGLNCCLVKLVWLNRCFSLPNSEIVCQAPPVDLACLNKEALADVKNRLPACRRAGF
jgi:hypothetical protein